MGPGPPEGAWGTPPSTPTHPRLRVCACTRICTPASRVRRVSQALSTSSPPVPPENATGPGPAARARGARPGNEVRARLSRLPTAARARSGAGRGSGSQLPLGPGRADVRTRPRVDVSEARARLELTAFDEGSGGPHRPQPCSQASPQTLGGPGTLANPGQLRKGLLLWGRMGLWKRRLSGGHVGICLGSEGALTCLRAPSESGTNPLCRPAACLPGTSVWPCPLGHSPSLPHLVAVSRGSERPSPTALGTSSGPR